MVIMARVNNNFILKISESADGAKTYAVYNIGDQVNSDVVSLYGEQYLSVKHAKRYNKTSYHLDADIKVKGIEAPPKEPVVDSRKAKK